MEEQVEEIKLKRMIKRILELEQNNAKTKDFNENEMIAKIKKIIEEEEKCY